MKMHVIDLGQLAQQIAEDQRRTPLEAELDRALADAILAPSFDLNDALRSALEGFDRLRFADTQRSARTALAVVGRVLNSVADDIVEQADRAARGVEPTSEETEKRMRAANRRAIDAVLAETGPLDGAAWHQLVLGLHALVGVIDILRGQVEHAARERLGELPDPNKASDEVSDGATIRRQLCSRCDEPAEVLVSDHGETVAACRAHGASIRDHMLEAHDERVELREIQ